MTKYLKCGHMGGGLTPFCDSFCPECERKRFSRLDSIDLCVGCGWRKRIIYVSPTGDAFCRNCMEDDSSL